VSPGKVRTVEEITTELYGVPLDRFTPTRNAAAKELKAAGDTDGARQVQALKKPTLAAWFVNQLVRNEPDQVNLLLELGQEMRAGMSGLSGDDLRLLTKRRYQLVSILVNTALSAAGSRKAGGDVAADVQATLEATLADPDSAEAVEAGCLSEPLHASSFGFTAPRPDQLVVEEPGPDADVVDIAAHRERRAKALEAAQARVAEAKEAVEEADTERAECEEALADAEQAEREAAAEVRRLETSLERATTALAKRTDAVAEAREALDAAEEEAEEAHEELAEAKDAAGRLVR
jgi:hypothetical protein